MKLYTVEQIRAIERAEFARRDSFDLMRAAAAAVARQAAVLAPTGRVVAIAGGGNNGGDACLAASVLRDDGREVTVFLLDEPQAADARRAVEVWRAGASAADASGGGGGAVKTDIGALAGMEADLIIDGLFGIGLNRAVEGRAAEWIAAMNAHPAPVLAIDVPSGLNADSGLAMGACVRAHSTVTFFGGKVGLFSNDGRDVCGTVVVDELEHRTEIADSGRLLAALPAAAGDLLARRRPATAHKGTYGTAVLLGGDDGMLGALVLAARAAARLGAGKVRAAAVGQCPPVDWAQPEIMWSPAADGIAGDVYAVGMGLGLGADSATILKSYAAVEKPLLLDADALTLLAADDEIKAAVAGRTAATVLTPHPGEAARLLGTGDASQVQAQRLASAQKLAADYNAVVVLKGAGSIIAEPGGQWRLCAAGNAGLARGGSGDVLAGMTAALMRQVPDVFTAVCAAVWLHSKAADELAWRNGMVGLDINQIPTTATHLIHPVGV